MQIHDPVQPQQGSTPNDSDRAELDERLGTNSLSEIFARLGRDGSVLVKHELALAKLELAQKARAASRDAILIAVGAGVCAAAGLISATAVVLLLSQLMAAWLAAALVAMVLALGGMVLLLVGVRGIKALDESPWAAACRVRRDLDAVKSALTSERAGERG